MGRRIRTARELVVVLVLALALEAQIRQATLPTLVRRFGLTLADDTASAHNGSPMVLPQWTRLPLTTVDRVMSRWPWGGTCLRRTLLLGHRLRGLGVQVRIGIQVDRAGQVAAHSWLVLHGTSLDPEAAAYRPLSGLSR